MEIVSLIFNGLTLAVALAVLALFIREKKANAKRRTDLMNYFDSSIAAALDIQKEHFREVKTSLKEGLDLVYSATHSLELSYRENFEKQGKRIKNLEDGVIPDYNEAVAAKNAVDDFSAGVMAILTHGNPVKKPDETEEVGDG